MAYEKELQYEFDAEEGSFLLQLRIDFFWDHSKLIRVLRLMGDCCKHIENASSISRYWADGFWHFSKFVESWSSHPNFPKIYSQAYYDKTYEIIYVVCGWFFSGRYPWTIENGLEKSITELNVLIE